VSHNNNRFAALASFGFNIGETQFRGSTLLKKLNKGGYVSATRVFAGLWPGC